jgi:uncharacterized protein
MQITTLEQLREIIPAPSERALLATIGPWGIEVSQKGGDPGFIEVADERTLLIPEYKGNQFALALGNILSEPRVGLALLVPATDDVLRISGRATLIHDDATCERLSGGGKPAVLAIRIEVERAAFHCPRSARRGGLWQSDGWDPPQKISFGQIYAESLASPEIRELFDELSKVSDAKLY